MIVACYQAYVAFATNTTTPNAPLMIYGIFNSNPHILRITLYVVITLVSDLFLVQIYLNLFFSSVLSKSLVGVSYLDCLGSQLLDRSSTLPRPLG
jgi:hypothetical protein